VFGCWANSGQNLYRTAIVREVGGYDPSAVPCEDRKLFLALSRRGPVFLLPGVGMDYRQHAGQSSKLREFEALRRRMWDGFIATLPPREKRQGKRVRDAAELVAEAEAARAVGNFLCALRCQLAAYVAAPYLLTSPLTARPLWWGLKKCLLRVAAP